MRTKRRKRVQTLGMVPRKINIIEACFENTNQRQDSGMAQWSEEYFICKER